MSLPITTGNTVQRLNEHLGELLHKHKVDRSNWKYAYVREEFNEMRYERQMYYAFSSTPGAKLNWNRDFGAALLAWEMTR